MDRTKGHFKQLVPQLIIIFGIAAILWVIFLPPTLTSVFQEFNESSLGGFRRLLVYFLFGLFFLLLGWIIYRWRYSLRAEHNLFFLFRSRSSSDKRLIWQIRIFILMIVGFITMQSIFSFQMIDELDSLTYIFFQPIFIWGFSVCLISLLYILLFKDEFKLRRGTNLRQALVLLLILAGLGLVLQILGLRYSETNRVNGNFDLTGYPILGYQVLIGSLITIIGFTVINFVLKPRDNKSSKRLVIIDIVIAVILFGAAYSSWLSVPIQKHAFYDLSRPPNYEIYPNSDANLYDRTALSLLTTGNLQTYTYRFEDYVAKRPMLAIYHAGLHAVAGLDYEDLIPVQTAVFSVLPVIVYLLGSALHSRPAGFLAGGMFIIREFNGIQLSDSVTGIHSQLLMSEIPTLIFNLLFFVIIFNAGRNKRNQGVWYLAAGGVIGIAMLFRQESVVLLLASSAGIILFSEQNIKSRIVQVLILLAGMIVVITPWITRNWAKSGSIYLDVPGNRLDLIRGTLNTNQREEPAEIPVQEEGQLFDDDLKVLLAILPVKGTRPGVTNSLAYSWLETGPVNLIGGRLQAILKHFSNQLFQTVLYLPSNPLMMDMDFLSKGAIGKLEHTYGGLFYSPESYVKTLPYWWPDWSGKIPPKSIPSILVTLFFLSFGVLRSWKSNRENTANLILAYFAYISVYALIRRSGGRFLQEMDWVSLMFYSIGIAAIIRKLISGDGVWLDADDVQSEQSDPIVSDARGPVLKYTALTFSLLLIGALPVLFEAASRNPYHESYLTEKTNQLISNDLGSLDHELGTTISNLILEGDVDVVTGKAYYPRNFSQGEMVIDIRPENIGKLEQRFSVDRLEFYLIGTDTAWVVLPTIEVSTGLQHGSEVLAVGCLQDGVMDTVLVIRYDHEGNLVNTYSRDGALNSQLSCPLLWED